MENAISNNIDTYQGLKFIALVGGRYKKLLNAIQNFSYKELDFEPGYEFQLYGDGITYNGVEHVKGYLTVIRKDRTIDDEKSGVIAISVNDLNTSGKLYTESQFSQIAVDQLALFLSDILSQGLETYRNLLSFAEYAENQITKVIILNQNYTELYRNLWNAKTEIWKVLDRDLMIKTWNCLLDLRFAGQIFYIPTIDVLKVNFVNPNATDAKKANAFKYLNSLYVPILAETGEAYIGDFQIPESIELNPKTAVPMFNFISNYKVHSQRALETSRELLKVANIMLKEENEIIDNPELPVIPEIYVDPGVGVNTGENKTPETSTSTSTSKKIISVSTILYLLTKLI